MELSDLYRHARGDQEELTLDGLAEKWLDKINAASLQNYEQYEATVLDAQHALETRMKESLIYGNIDKMSTILLAVREKVLAVVGDEEDDEEGDYEKVRTPKL